MEEELTKYTRGTINYLWTLLITELFAKSKIQIDLTLINFQFIISLTVFIITLFHLFIYF